jgi:hypothetical protein
MESFQTSRLGLPLLLAEHFKDRTYVNRHPTSVVAHAQFKTLRNVHLIRLTGLTRLYHVPAAKLGDETPCV